jgi:hypothetical protein
MVNPGTGEGPGSANMCGICEANKSECWGGDERTTTLLEAGMRVYGSAAMNVREGATPLGTGAYRCSAVSEFS